MAELNAEVRGDNRRATGAADWKALQQKTFQNWANQALNENGPGMTMNDMIEELDNGVFLVSVVESLIGEKCGVPIISFIDAKKMNPARKMMAYRETLTGIFKFLQEHEKIKLVNIGPQDLLEHSPVAILGLMWTLILHYDIKGNRRGGHVGSGSAKSQLLEWLRSVIPEQGIKNFTSDWRNGKNLTALIMALCPDALPPPPHPSDPVELTALCIKCALEKMGVAELVSAEDLCNPMLDDLSGMTFLSAYRNYYYKNQKEIDRRLNINGAADLPDTEEEDRLEAERLAKLAAAAAEEAARQKAKAEQDDRDRAERAARMAAEAAAAADIEASAAAARGAAAAERAAAAQVKDDQKAAVEKSPGIPWQRQKFQLKKGMIECGDGTSGGMSLADAKVTAVPDGKYEKPNCVELEFQNTNTGKLQRLILQGQTPKERDDMVRALQQEIKFAESGGVADWNSRWFQLSSNILKYFRKDAAGTTTVEGEIDMVDAKVEAVSFANRPFCVKVTSTTKADKSLVMQAPTDDLRMEWVQALNREISAANALTLA